MTKINIARRARFSSRAGGFTLIELLVVIAIIGILSAVVLASLSTARSKGQDAAVQSDLNTIQTQAEIYYNNNSSTYGTASAVCTGGMFADTSSTGLPIVNALANIATDNGGAANQSCDSSGSAYAVMAKSVSNPSAVVFCVDSTGFSGTTTDTTLTAQTHC